MADSDTGGQSPAPAASGSAVVDDGQPQVLINAQYIKDFSFENPRAPHSLLQTQAAPEVQIGVDVKAQTLAPGLYEVMLTIHADAKSGNDRVFLVELVYAAVTTAQNVPESDLARILLVETPRMLFPFARAIVANATREGGFMPLLLRPIDFAELVRQQQAAAVAAGQAPAVA
ncbi:MAG TPA: protein-export chaperone SecB [Stellaceae bacterium]|nr:protein-export chaperone SecB [Stellaceae bacterium]